MTTHPDAIRQLLANGPVPARQLSERLGISQPTMSRAIAALGEAIVRIGAARSIQYALRDNARGLPDIPVYRVDADGRIQRLGILIPVKAEGFVMLQEDGVTLYSPGLPWWLLDMRPQGYLGRAYAERHGTALGLPLRLNHWTDTHVLRALLSHGHDMVGNLLLGDLARDRFLSERCPQPHKPQHKAAAYARLASEATSGELAGSSAGGEQPKFTCHATTDNGPRHLIVKFTDPEASPVSERWRDLVLAEHLALATLREAGVPAAVTHIADHHPQRFLEVERFDRHGTLGRRGLISLAALDAEFVGSGNEPWPAIARRLAALGHIQQEAAATTDLLWAYGTLIGNTDMHSGNLSFLYDNGTPFSLAPAYDMTPMAFAPRAGGGLPERILDANIIAAVPNPTWRQAETLARDFLARLKSEGRFSQRFIPCIAALEAHIQTAANRIARLG